VAEPLLFPDPPAAPSLTAEQIAAVLRGYRLPVTVEAAMQLALVMAFESERIAFKREVTRGLDRIDFVVGRVGVECKVHCPTNALARQLLRYALWDDIDELLVVTSDAKHVAVPPRLNGKDVRVHVVRGMLF
jgi:hypothetical protein